MRCPNCGAKIRKGNDRCLKCGTKLEQIEGASHKKVSTARKEYQPELVVYTTVFPVDLSYKHTLIYSIFFGWFGGHLYFVKRYFKAIMMSVMSVIFLICGFPIGVFLKTGDAGIFNPLVSFLMTGDIYIIPCVLGAIGVIMWVVDIIKIITRTFPVPVVLAENKK